MDVKKKEVGRSCRKINRLVEKNVVGRYQHMPETGRSQSNSPHNSRMRRSNRLKLFRGIHYITGYNVEESTELHELCRSSMQGFMVHGMVVEVVDTSVAPLKILIDKGPSQKGRSDVEPAT